MASKSDEFDDSTGGALELQRLKEPSQSVAKDKWTLNLFLCCLTAATAAFQFGYNLSSLNSVTIPVQGFIREHLFIFDQNNSSLSPIVPSNTTEPHDSIAVNTTDTMEVKDLHQVEQMKISQQMNYIWTFVNCMFVFGQFLGGFATKYVLDMLGRKKTILFHNIFAVIASVLVIVAPFVASPVCVMISRFFFGMHSGFVIAVVPIYLSEIAPTSLRGSAGGFTQLFISFGITFAQILGFKEIFGNDSFWYLLLGFPIVPAVLGSIVLLIFFPESPKALLSKNKDYEAAKKALQLLRNRVDVKQELDEIYQETLHAQEVVSFKDLFTSAEMRWPLIITLTLVVALQVSGINAIFFYSTSIFKDAGIPQQYIQYVILFTGLINIPANIACMPLIEKFGRRSLYLTTVLLVVIDYIALTILLTFKDVSPYISYASIGCILFFITLFALAIGPIAGIYATEVFRQQARGAALAVAGMAGCIAFLFVAFLFPVLQAIINQYVFLVFAGSMSIVFVILFLKMPETKGKSVDEIMALFQKK